MAAQAAVSASVFVLILFYAAFEVVASGAGPLIARATGAGDLELRRRLFGQSLSAMLVQSAFLMAIGVAAAPAIAVALGLSGAPAAECSRYLTALFATILPLALTPLIDQTFLAMGNARAPLVLHALSLALNVALTPLLVYEAGLGVVGAALASNAARGVASALGIWQLRRDLGLRSAHLRARGDLRRILRIGAPMALGTALFAGVYWGLLWMDYTLARMRSGARMAMTRFWLYKAGNEDEQVIWRDTILFSPCTSSRSTPSPFISRGIFNLSQNGRTI